MTQISLQILNISLSQLILSYPVGATLFQSENSWQEVLFCCLWASENPLVACNKSTGFSACTVQVAVGDGAIASSQTKWAKLRRVWAGSWSCSSRLLIQLPRKAPAWVRAPGALWRALVRDAASPPAPRQWHCSLMRKQKAKQRLAQI